MARSALRPDLVLSAPMWLRIAAALVMAGVGWGGVIVALGTAP
jgi:hypothetical protein